MIISQSINYFMYPVENQEQPSNLVGLLIQHLQYNGANTSGYYGIIF